MTVWELRKHLERIADLLETLVYIGLGITILLSTWFIGWVVTL